MTRLENLLPYSQPLNCTGWIKICYETFCIDLGKTHPELQYVRALTLLYFSTVSLKGSVYDIQGINIAAKHYVLCKNVVA